MPQQSINPQTILSQFFKHKDFLPSQKKVIDHILNTPNQKGHALVLMPTGGGKSLCYQLPALCLPGQTIVISPLIALMQDQVEALKEKNIPASYINSSLGKLERESRLQDFASEKIKILYVTPERFRQKPFVEVVQKNTISLLAVDEAHCISEWGQDFRPDYAKIGEYRELLGNPLTVALTATATPEVQEDIIAKLHLTKQEIPIFHSGIKRPNLKLSAIDVIDNDEKFKEIQKTLSKVQGATIIYFALIKSLTEFSELLRKQSINHTVYHGQLPPHIRKKTQTNFMKNGGLILATNAFGMGIDKSDIRCIIHAELPGSVEAYYQEIGRAGRDGKPSICQLLYNQQDLMIQMDFIKWSNPEPYYYKKLHQLLEEKKVQINDGGLDYIREQLHYKTRYDFRLETALNMLERYNVVEGSLDKRDLRVVSPLHINLVDESIHEEKLLRDRKRLLAVVEYFRTEECRRSYISGYFGFPEKACGHCDLCAK